MKNRKNIIFIFLLLLINCKKESIKNEEESSVNTGQIYTEKFENKGLRDSLKDKALYSNDTIAYKGLRIIYFLSGNADDFYYTALIMYNRNKYMPASKDLYFILNKNHLDKKTEKQANEYLKDASKRIMSNSQ